MTNDNDNDNDTKCYSNCGYQDSFYFYFSFMKKFSAFKTQTKTSQETFIKKIT